MRRTSTANRLVVVLVAVLCVSAFSGCSNGSGAERGFPRGSSVHTMSVGGLDRTYRVYRPADLPAAAPLVIMLHGGVGSGEQAERAYGWDQLADSARFIVAYPDGIGRAWNVHGCCGRPARDSIDDIGFITSMVGRVSDAVGIDRSRVYATGISNGGMMSYTLACNSNLFAAVGPDSATQLDPCLAPHPTSVIHIHGTSDRLIRYNGGEGEGSSRVDGPPVPDVNQFWRNVDHCGQPTLTTDGSVTTSTATCAANRGVVLITVDGGGHEWPAFATRRLWDFFAAHPGAAPPG
jgi:polyhydroxybutyrate depolymerase